MWHSSLDTHYQDSDAQLSSLVFIDDVYLFDKDNHLSIFAVSQNKMIKTMR